MIKKIETWLKDNRHFGLELPNGWFGRPYDNAHQATWYVERENKLIIELDNQLYLIFTKPLTLKTGENDLIFTEFRQFVFDRQGYENMYAYAEIFKDGNVSLKSYKRFK